MRLKVLVTLSVPALVVGLIGLNSCGSSAKNLWPNEYVARQVLTAAENRDIAELQTLAGSQLIVNVARPSMTFKEFLVENDLIHTIDKIIAAMSFEPKLRLSPLGDGTVQRLWVYPGFAITSPTCWSETDNKSAINQDLFSANELDQFKSDDAYRGISLGFAEDGQWVFILKDRVSRTPPNAKVEQELQCE